MKRSLPFLSILSLLLLFGCSDESTLTGTDSSDGTALTLTATAPSEAGVDPTFIEDAIGNVADRCEVYAPDALPGEKFTPPRQDPPFESAGFGFTVSGDDAELLAFTDESDVYEIRAVFVYHFDQETGPGNTNGYIYDTPAESDAGLQAPSGESITHFAFCYNEAPPPPPLGDEGCTPGYWKNHQDSWASTPYTTDQTLGSVFDVPEDLRSGNGKKKKKKKKGKGSGTDFGNTSLLDALQFGGGPGVEGASKILFRAAVSALLNASADDVEYARTEDSVIEEVNDVLASGDRGTILDLASALDDDNNATCPLN